MPWALELVRTQQMLPDGRFVTIKAEGRLPRWIAGEGGTRFTDSRDHPDRYKETFDYCYILESGEVQNRTVEVTVERMTYAWYWPWMLGIFRPSVTRTWICVNFSEEVGEEVGSWKGGCIGCGYTLRSGETPEQCLRRMERERKF